MIIQIGRVRYPDQVVAANAESAVKQLFDVWKQGNLGRVHAIMPKAETALNALNVEMARFGQEMAGRAFAGSVVFGLTALAGFAVVGHVLAAKLVALEVVASAGTAEVVVQSGMAAIKSVADQLGNYSAGEGGSLKGSLMNVVVDTLTAALTAGIASKIKPKYFDELAKKVVGKFAGATGIDSATMQRLLTSFLSSAGQETMKSGAGEVAGLLGKGIKSGKAPTREDVDEALTKVLTTALTAGFLNQIVRTQKAIAVRSRDAVQKSCFDKALKEFLGRGGTIPDKERMKLWAEVWGKVEDQVVQGLLNTVFKEAKVVDSKKMEEQAMKLISTDTGIYKMIKDETELRWRKRKLMSGSSNAV